VPPVGALGRYADAICRVTNRSPARSGIDGGWISSDWGAGALLDAATGAGVVAAGLFAPPDVPAEPHAATAIAAPSAIANRPAVRRAIPPSYSRVSRG
jgi:hypothetical protein